MPVVTATAGLRRDLTLRLRECALRDAERAVAAAIARQSAAEATLAEAMRTIAECQEQAMRSSSDEDVEAFAYWLPEGRRAVWEADARLTAAAAATAGARAALALARMAVLAETAGPRSHPPAAAAASGCDRHPDGRHPDGRHPDDRHPDDRHPDER